MGIKCPIIREGDNLVDIVVDSVLQATAKDWDQMSYGGAGHEPGYYLNNKDVIGVTESVVARSQGNYVTVDDIVNYMDKLDFKKKLVLYSPIMSRNRFSIILKAFARYADEITIVLEGDRDEHGNPTSGINQFTGVDIQKYYTDLCESENCKLSFFNNKDIDDNAVVHTEKNYSEFNTRVRYYLNFNTQHVDGVKADETYIDCRCHPENSNEYNLASIMLYPMGENIGYNSLYGLLGSNKATDEKLKLFPEPSRAQEFVEEIQKKIYNQTGKHVEVMVYGDGCFKDPVGGIWEWADPDVSPAYTKGLEGTPNEIKIKAFADDQFKDLSGEELTEAIKTKIQEKNEGMVGSLVGSMASQGTTPRRYVDLLGSLMDLTSGSGDRGTPIILVQNYFSNFANN